MVVAKKKNFLGLDIYESAEDEPYMSKDQKEHFLKILQVWYRLLISEMNEFKTSLQLEELCMDDVDKASYEENQRMSFKTSERRSKLQKKVKEAIDRLWTLEYGYCKVCLEEIGLNRLEARPTADQCISCKTIAELYEQRSLE
jgi:DnaK suppressor protein